MLEGFKKFNVSIGTASISVSQHGIAFSRTAVIRMDKAPYVCLYIDETTKRLAIQKSDENEEGVTKFYNNQKVVAVRWNNSELLKTVSNMMDWDLGKYIYKIDGEYEPNQRAIIFDLKKAKMLEVKNNKKND